MATTGLFASLTRLGGTLVGIAQARLALLATDAEEARLQLLSLLALAAVAALGIGVGVVLGSIALVIGFWDTHRILVLGLLAGFYAVAGGLAWWLAMRRLRSQPRPFAASLAELARDRESLSAP